MAPFGSQTAVAGAGPPLILHERLHDLSADKRHSVRCAVLSRVMLDAGDDGGSLRISLSNR